MIEDIQILIDKYLVWLRDKTSLREINNWVEITTPYLDRHNDYVQIYAKRENGIYLLTDDGYTLDDLESSGCKINSPKRIDLLKMTLNGFGVTLEDKILQVKSSEGNFALKKHNLVQAILAVNDLFYLSAPVITSLFYEDVVAWLDVNEIRYTPKVKFSGKSGYDHLYDFVIPRSKHQPERVIQTINRPRRDTAERFVMSWFDTREVRSPDSTSYAVLNDSEEYKSLEQVIEALSNYQVNTIPWSDRDRFVGELAA